MHREIKFRAWHGGHEFEPAQMIYDNNPGDCLVWKLQGQNIDDIMQNTGRKTACDDKEIYQGDILSFVIFNYDGSDQGVKTGYVDWDGAVGAWIVRESSDSENGWWLYLVLDNDNGVEIIGNIYENPELLKED